MQFFFFFLFPNRSRRFSSDAGDPLPWRWILKCFNFAPSEDDETATSDAIPGARRRWISFFVAQLSEVRGQFRAFCFGKLKFPFERSSRERYSNSIHAKCFFTWGAPASAHTYSWVNFRFERYVPEHFWFWFRFELLLNRYRLPLEWWGTEGGCCEGIPYESIYVPLDEVFRVTVGQVSGNLRAHSIFSNRIKSTDTHTHTKASA